MQQDECTTCFICFESCDTSTHCSCKLFVCNACLLKSLENKPNICTICKTPYKNVKSKLHVHKFMKSSNVRLFILSIFSILSTLSTSIVLLFAFYEDRQMIIPICFIFLAMYSFFIVFILYHVRHTACISLDLFDHYVVDT